MKKMLILGIGLLVAARVFSQETGTDGAPVIPANPDHSAFIAYLTNNNVVQMRWGRSVNDQIDHYVVEHSTDGSFFDPMHGVGGKNGRDPDSRYFDAGGFPAQAL